MNRIACNIYAFFLLGLFLQAPDAQAANSSGLKQAPSGWVEDGSETLTPTDKAQSNGRSQQLPAPTPDRRQSGDGEGFAGKQLGAQTPRMDDRATTAGAAQDPKVLQGGIEHSQQLPALPHSLSVGATYNERNFNTPARNDEWYEIPDWLAGDWRRDEETIVSTFNYQTGTKNNEPHTIAATEIAQFGVQRDRLGGVWHCRLATGGMADCGSYNSVARLQTQEPMVVARDYVVMRDVFTELHVNKETQAIIYSAQAESLTRYEPRPDGTLSVTTSVKIFDQNGEPKERQKNISTTLRIKQFTPLNTYKGRDLLKQFRDYLSAQGKQNLLP